MKRQKTVPAQGAGGCDDGSVTDASGDAALHLEIAKLSEWLETSAGVAHEPRRNDAMTLFETLHMRHLPTLLFLAALLPSLAWTSPASAQASRPAANVSLAQAERNAVELKQGMSLEQVQTLLGKPRRTALKNDGSFSTSAASQGTLQWTYTWTGSSSQASLHIQFATKTPEEWYVNSWEWGSY
jgi:hypothetical protein